MNPVSELTYKVLAFSVAPDFEWNDCVDWAYEMLLLGYDTSNLLILAGISKPADYYGTFPYFSAALGELGLKEKTGEEAIIFYSGYLLRKIIARQSIRENLAELGILHYSNGYPELIQDFYLLNDGWGDIDREMGSEYYWPGATKENIEQIVIDKACKWLSEHESKLYL